MLIIRLNRIFTILVVSLFIFTLVPLTNDAQENGKIVFISNRDGNDEIYVMNADGSSLVRLTDTSATERDPAWSPDGEKIVFVSDREGNEEIYIMNADGSNVKKLSPDSFAVDLNPAWSPDGEKIAFNSNRDGAHEIYVMDADGSNVVRLTHDKAWNACPAWSPDGNRIAYVCTDFSTILSNGNISSQIRVMNADGSNMEELSKVDDSQPAWSPDGKRIVFESFRDGNYEIYVMNADGTEQKRLTRNSRIDKMPKWSPDGKRIAFVSNRDGNHEIYIMNADGSGVVRVTENSSRDSDFDWHRQRIEKAESEITESETKTETEKGFCLGTVLVTALMAGSVFFSKKRRRNGIKILFIAVIVASLGLLSYFFDTFEVSIPDAEEVPLSELVEVPDPTESDIVWIKIKYWLHGTHGYFYKFYIKRHSDGDYYLDEVLGFHDQSISTGQKIDADLIQELKESFTDFYPAQKAYSEPQGLDGYPSFEVVVKLENGEALEFFSCPFDSLCCGIPWNIEYNNKKYMQLNGKFPTALFKILANFDKQIEIRFDKEIRWGCSPCVLYYEHYDPNLSEDIPRSEKKTTPLEEEGKSHVLWEADIPPLVCPPAYAEGNLYIATESHIIALDAETAKKLWEVEIEREEPSTGTLIDTHSRGNITVYEGTIYAAIPPSVYCLNAQGNILWEYTADQCSSLKISISGNTLVVCNVFRYESWIAFLDARTGEEVWEISGDPHLVDVFDGKILYKEKNYTLVDIDSRKVIWEKKSSSFVMRQPDFVNWNYYNGILYFDKEEGAFVAVDTETFKEWLVYPHGKFVSEYEPGTLLQYCKAFGQGILLSFLEFGEKEWPLSTWSTRIVFLDKTGGVLWERHYDENSVGVLYSISFLFYYSLLYNPVEGAEIYLDTLYVWRHGGFIEAFNVEDGEKLWESEVRDSIKSFHMYSSIISVAANDCKVYCLDARTGTILWELQLCDSHCTIHIEEPDEPFMQICVCDHPVYVFEIEKGVLLVVVEDMLVAVSVEG